MKAEGNTAVIRALFAQLDALGVMEFCVCAGARNAPIIEVLTTRAASLQNSECKIYHFFDERSAAFFALGRVMESRTPVAVLTTSGTAVAELLPAMVEAYYQNIPLVAVSADRPSRYRGSGAPQSIEQQGIFGIYATSVEMECGLLNVAHRNILMGRNGPVHFNVCLEEGAITEVELPTLEKGEISVFNNPADADPFRNCREWTKFIESEGSLVVLAAGIHGIDYVSLTEFLMDLKAPIMAEATSNLWGDPRLEPFMIRGGEKALAALNATRVVRIGSVPSWRWWRELENRPEVRVLNISRTPFSGLARTENVTTLTWMMFCNCFPPDLGCDFSKADKSILLNECLLSCPKSEPAWMRHISRIIPAGPTVFLGNSLPIREWNLAADKPKPGTVFFANRGANGIDGLVSTWLGVSAEADESWIIVGDLSALYDLGAPWILAQLKKSKRRIVIINNGGGKIFSRVNWLKDMPADAKRVMENPHALSFESWAQMWGMDYRLITEPAELLDDASPCAVWEIKPDAAQTEAFWSAWK